MRRLLSILVLGALTGSPVAIAQSEFTFVGRGYYVAGGGATSFGLRCPPGFVVTQVQHSADGGLAPAEGDVNIRLVDRGGIPVTLENPTEALNPEGGVDVSILSSTPRREAYGEIFIFCVVQTMVTNVVASQAELAQGATDVVSGMCPAPTIAIGEVHTMAGFRDELRAYLYGAPPTVTLVDDLPDGEQIPPSGMRLRATNTAQSAATLRMVTLCGPIGNARTLVTSVGTSPGQPFSFAAPVPDNRLLIGMTAVGGINGRVERVGLWGVSGVVLPELSYVIGAPEARDVVRGMFIGGNASGSSDVPTKASNRAVVGALVIPAPAPPAPTIVEVVEFHHPVLDHYFITAIPQEISDLDSGVHGGWERTGESFRVYAPGSSGPPGRQPVCRAYGDPLAGLDSHFYSVSPEECTATLRGFNRAWLLEASEVFQADAPNAVTGACVAGGIPIYRLWNGRSDSNHRYVSSLALRNQMMGAGWISEGYGVNGVAICTL
jgi:hypothetical protein